MQALAGWNNRTQRPMGMLWTKCIAIIEREMSDIAYITTVWRFDTIATQRCWSSNFTWQNFGNIYTLVYFVQRDSRFPYNCILFAVKTYQKVEYILYIYVWWRHIRKIGKFEFLTEFRFAIDACKLNANTWKIWEKLSFIFWLLFVVLFRLVFLVNTNFTETRSNTL